MLYYSGILVGRFIRPHFSTRSCPHSDLLNSPQLTLELHESLHNEGIDYQNQMIN